MRTKTLYKRTAGNKIQTWYMEIDGAHYRSVSGQVDGEKVTSEWTVAKPKNKGRANSTESAEQAQAEVASHYAKKVKHGYVEDELAAAGDERFKVMLAHKYEDFLDKLVRPTLAQGETVWSQPKLDGVRCWATRHGLTSRNNTPIPSCPHIEAALAPFFEAFPDAILDGELYNHELRHDFDTLLSILRKTTGLTEEDLALSAVMAQYHIYDAAGMWGDLNLAAENFVVRIGRVKQLVEDLGESMLVAVRTDPCINEDKIDFLYEMFLTNGYEGLIVRFDVPYRAGARSKYLLKRKDAVDAEYVVIDIVEGDGNRSGMAGFAILELPGGKGRFNSNLKGGVEFYKKLLKDKAKYIGGQATVTYTNLTPRGVPRFPRIAKDKWWPGGRDL